MQRVGRRTTAGGIAQGIRLLGSLFLLVAARGVNAADEPIAGGRWALYEPRAIETHDGIARIAVSPEASSARTLVIVSTLSRDGGPFRMRLTVPARPGKMGDASGPPGRPIRPLPGEGRPIRHPVRAAGGAASKDSMPPAHRRFHLMVKDGDVASPSNYKGIDAELRGLGRRIQVYVDRDDVSRVPDATLREIVRTFDDRILPTCSARFGPSADVDRDGRFTVFISGWLTRLSSGRVHVDGFVRGADFDVRLPEPFSNHSDMMYLSSALAPDAHLRTILAHEYGHAVIFSRRAFGEVGAQGELIGTEEEGWLDEGLAHLIEDLFGYSRSNLDYRISAFLSQPERYRLVVEDYYAANLFRSHGNRGGTYLFLRWCLDRFGTNLLDAMVRSPKRGLENVEAATGARFEDLYREWTVAMALNGVDPGRPDLGGIHSLELRGEMDGWILAGPRIDLVSPGSPAREWDQASTASRYFVLHSPDRRPLDVKIVAPSGSGLQVTVVRLPEDAPLLDVAAVASRSPRTPAGSQVRFRVKEQGGVGVRLGALAWESAVPARLTAGRAPAATLPRGGLDQLAIASKFGSSAVRGGGTVLSGPVPLGAFAEDDGPIVFKLLGVDAKGRRVSAWTTLDLKAEDEVAEGPANDAR